MTINKKQIKEKTKEAEEVKQREQAEKLVKIAEEFFKWIDKQGVKEVWELQTIHSLIGKRMQTAIGGSKIGDIIKKK